MNSRSNGWITAILGVALCALVLVFATTGANAQQGGQGNNLFARVAALEVLVGAQQDEIQALATDLSAERQSRQNADVATLAAANAYTDGQNSGLTSRIFAVEEKTQYMSVLGDTTLFSGTNVQVVNGMGDTETTNGLGNLIVGYNEASGGFGDERNGSHNIVVGMLHDYLAHGGLVAGYANRIAGNFSSVTGGSNNTASGLYASVTGGRFNIALADISSVTGGSGNTASGRISSVTGGVSNIASGELSSVTGGVSNISSHAGSAVSGGRDQSTSSDFQWVGGFLHSP